MASKPVEWYFIGTGILLLEWFLLNKKSARIASSVIWEMRSDKVGKILLTASWMWFTYHFFFEKRGD